MKIKINYDDENLYCVYCKEQIEIDERYIELYDPDDGCLKTYKFECAPVDNEDDCPYIG